MDTKKCRVCPVVVAEGADPPKRKMSKRTGDRPPAAGLKRVQRARIEAPVEDLKRFFGPEAGRLTTLTLEVNVCDFLMAQRALVSLLGGWRVVRECRYRGRRPAMVQRHAVEIAPDRYDFVIRAGRQFWDGPGEERLVVDLEVEDDRREPYSQMTFLLPESRYGWIVELLPRLRQWMDEHHFLRGQGFTAAGEFIRAGELLAWEDVFLPPAVRDSIERNCIQLLRHSALFRANGVPLKRGILLHGPPGTGKTTIGRALARTCDVTFILTSPGMLEFPADVRRVFEWGRRLAPAILFFEDFDLVAGDRESPRSSGGLLGEFLTCLDGLGSSEGIIVFATTNNLHAIEPAIKDRPNRFDCVLEVPPMRRRQRRAYLEAWARRRNGRFDAARIAARTEGYTGAQLQELCRLAVQEAVALAIERGRTDAITLPIGDECFEGALARMTVRRRRKIGFIAQEDDDA